MSEQRYVVEWRDQMWRGYRWHGYAVIDRQTGEMVAGYSRRTNWIDGRDGKPYGPQAAAEEMARRFNEGEAVPPTPEYGEGEG